MCCYQETVRYAASSGLWVICWNGASHEDYCRIKVSNTSNKIKVFVYSRMCDRMQHRKQNLILIRSTMLRHPYSAAVGHI